MNSPRIGSLCTGYGGLDQAAQAVFGGDVAWTSDIDKGACKIIAHRYPDVPNIGDFTKVDWAELKPIDILTAGYPCQPFSHAGKRKGTHDERHLWPHIREAVRVLRPRVTLLENVAGHRSLGFDRVLGDLAEDGMHVRWTSVRASDIGAPHQRERLFIVVTDPNSEGLPSLRGIDTQRRDTDRRSGADRLRPAAESTSRELSLLPTPAVNDMGEGKTVERWDEWTADMQARHGNGNGHGKSLAIEAQRLLPTPSVADVEGGRKARSGDRSNELLLNGIAAHDRWGDYAPAIARWEQTLDRVAPAPTQWSEQYVKMRARRLAGDDKRPVGRRGSLRPAPQLAPAFVEWLMGLRAGWVADVPGITRNEALKALGNGVVPQQAEAAIRWLLERIEVAA